MASDSYPPKLTPLERLDMIPASLSLVAASLYWSIAAVFRGKSGASSYNKHIKFALMRKAMTRLSIRQTQSTNPPSNEIYDAYIKKQGLENQTVTLKHGALGHWLGNKDAKQVVVYYHGGGFALPLNNAYFEIFNEIIEDFRAQGKDVAIFFLTYTLAPYAAYPTQTRQAVEALRYVIQETGRDPANVVIGGDSAGGNLTLGVLSHLSHPHEAIDQLDIPGPLAGSFLIAPWVSFSQGFPSFQKNANKDMLAPPYLARWSAAFLGGKKGDNYSEPFLAPAEWWKDLKTKDMLVVAGGDEVFLGSVEQFVEKLKSVFPSTSFIIGADEAHVAPIVNRMLNDSSETEQGKAVTSWLSARL
ncbi:hypothetical protein AJ80_04743 [Polytolypa hystricis UAMH7299]|uniref:Alpha/beta hydrolase fold-3 domain-containing protein n=1 Tax=Polytolypa hystricis (strain UAMH7299) TaxID=1447883 RepID=A0A2B7Y8J7_POLH7|nr:hypothetical protein AJ80_04743 [Polytolypa hystricis UAMH7299]